MALVVIDARATWRVEELRRFAGHEHGDLRLVVDPVQRHDCRVGNKGTHDCAHATVLVGRNGGDGISTEQARSKKA